MPKGKLRVIDGAAAEPPVYPAEIQPLMQSLLATLADIDFGHQVELEQVSRREGDEGLKSKVINQLARKHQERRAPWVHELLALEARSRSFLAP